MIYLNRYLAIFDMFKYINSTPIFQSVSIIIDQYKVDIRYYISLPKLDENVNKITNTT